MFHSTSIPSAPSFLKGEVVELVPDLAGVQSPDGELIVRERLGPGIVGRVDPFGSVLVRWLDAGLEEWADPSDLRSRGQRARLITVRRLDKHGNCKATARRLVPAAGLNDHWTAELLPGGVVRVVRSDGGVWTFHANWITGRIDTWWPQPPDDDDAEALTVAEMSLSRR